MITQKNRDPLHLKNKYKESRIASTKPRTVFLHPAKIECAISTILANQGLDESYASVSFRAAQTCCQIELHYEVFFESSNATARGIVLVSNQFIDATPDVETAIGSWVLTQAVNVANGQTGCAVSDLL